MRSWLVPLLFVYATAQAQAERHPQALELYCCAFEASADRNFDLWPDGWTRQGGPGYPKYVQMGISAEPVPGEGRALRIELDGGMAIAYSPPIACNHLVSCVLEGELRTFKLEHDQAFISLTFLDQKRRALATFTSEEVVRTDNWRKLCVGPVSLTDPRVAYVMVGLHLEPQSPRGRQDIHGAASFTNLWVGCLPRLTLATNSPGNLVTAKTPVEIACQVSGFEGPPPDVELTVEDALGLSLSREMRKLELTANTADSAASAAPSADLPDAAEQAAQRAKLTRRRQVSHFVWKPALPGPGFYRVRAGLAGPGTPSVRQSMTLAVIVPQTTPFESEFGWELRNPDPPGGLARLPGILSQAGVHWVKYPVWSTATAETKTADERLAELQNFCQTLNGQNMDLVAVLSDPPPEVRKLLADLRDPGAADVFSLPPDKWYPTVEPILARLAGQVRYWQLGADNDASFVGYAQLLPQLEKVRATLNTLGADVQLGLGWDWTHQLPATADSRFPFRFLALSARPPLTPAELAVNLQATQGSAAQRWVALSGLPRDKYSTAARVADLTECMIAAKMHEAEAIIAGAPFDPQQGLLERDGAPGELLLPWRTTALTLGGAQYLGPLELPHGSRGEMFTRGEQAVLVVWGLRDTTETLYLGEQVSQVDVWGRRRELPNSPAGQTIEIRALPSFVEGVNPAVMRWALDCTLSRTRFPSTVGQSYYMALKIRNHFASPVMGKLEIVPPTGWQVEPRQTDFNLAVSAATEIPLRLTLPIDAGTGRHRVRVNFDLRADRPPFQFSVYRHIDVGVGDVSIEIRTHLNADGQMEVEQCFVNDTHQRVNFRCELFAPNTQRQKWDVLNLGANREVHTYYLPNGRELVGKQLLLRAEELSGRRILNYRFTAEK